MAEADVISLKLREVLILDKQSLVRGHLFVVKVLTTSKKPIKKKIVRQIVKEKVADAYSYISGELLCALVPLFVDGMLRNTNKDLFSKWSHQNIFACFFVITRPKLLLFNNKCKTVKICQNAFTPNQGDTPLFTQNNVIDSGK